MTTDSMDVDDLLREVQRQTFYGAVSAACVHDASRGVFAMTLKGLTPAEVEECHAFWRRLSAECQQRELADR